MAIDGGTIVVGTPYDDDAGLTSGSAYVFLTTDGGATYGQVAKLTASDGAASDYFGYSVAISGGTVVVGAYWDDDGGYSSGSVYVFSGAGSEGLVAGSDSTREHPRVGRGDADGSDPRPPRRRGARSLAASRSRPHLGRRLTAG